MNRKEEENIFSLSIALSLFPYKISENIEKILFSRDKLNVIKLLATVPKAKDIQLTMK